MPREPIVIELKDGEVYEIEARRNATDCLLTLVADCPTANQSRHLRVSNGSHTMYFPFKPDPVRAAELKRDERAKCAVYQVLHDKSYAADLINEIYAAIDAPDEKPSAYERGHRDGEVGAKRRLRLVLLEMNCPKHILDVFDAQEPTP